MLPRYWLGVSSRGTRAVGGPKVLSDEQIAALARKTRDTGYGRHAPGR